MPVRIQRRRSKGWKLPENTVCVCRPGRLGNPFAHRTDPQQAVDAYRRLASGGTQCFECSPEGLHFAKGAHEDCFHWAFSDWLKKEALPKLRGKNLACFCPVDQPCHADVLLELANREDTTP